MIAAELEKRICAALRTALEQVRTARRPLVRGRWRDAADCKRGPELQPVGTLAEVDVGLPAYERFMLDKATVAVRVTTRFSNASAGAAATTVIPVTEAVCGLLDAWQTDGERLEADLGVEGFRPFALRATGGTAPTEEENWTSVAHDFTVTGVVARGGNQDEERN